MPETRSTLDWSKLLDGVERDLASEYNEVVDAIEQAKDKYSALWRNTETLIAFLTRSKAELDRITALRQEDLARYNKDIQMRQEDLARYNKDIQTGHLRFQAQARKLRQSRCVNESLHRRVRQLEGDLSAAKQELKKANQLICEICFDKIKNKVTKCGHTFCEGCLLLHARSQNYIIGDSLTEPDSFRCPGCRCMLRGEDVKDIYWGDAFQEVVALDSDTDSDSEEGDG